MKTPLAWLNLGHQWVRTLIAVAGISFAVVLVFMQLGFFGAVSTAATLLYDELDFDLVLTSPQYNDVNRAGTFPLTRLYQAQALPGVIRTTPLYVGFNYWYNPETRRRRNIMLLGFRPAASPFRFPEVAEHLAELRSEGNILMDRLSRPEFGPRGPGVETEIGARKVRVVGQFSLQTGFGADGVVIASDATLREILPRASPDRVSLGLVKLDAGASPAAVARELESVVQPAARVWTRAAMEARERRHWERNTSVGVIFGLGVVVALAVGMIFVYQVISSDITNHFAEYATLKAMGYSEGYLSGIVLRQAMILAVLGYLPGLAIALGLYQVTSTWANVPIAMTAARAAAVFGLALLMCALSGLLSLRKVRLADPADLF